MKSAYAAACVTLIATFICADVHGAPIQVRGRSHLTLEAQRTAEGFRLEGWLRDDHRQPIAGAPIHLKADGFQTGHAPTDSEGHFSVLLGGDVIIARIAKGATQLAWSARFDGSPRFGGALSQTTSDLSRAQSRLTLAINPPSASTDSPPVHVDLRLRGGNGPIAFAPVQLSIGEGPALVGLTSDDGRVTFRIRPADFDRAGQQRVIATYDGDHRFAPVTAGASLALTRATRLTLRVSQSPPPGTPSLRFSGRLTDAEGPVVGGLVTIAETEGVPVRVLALARTDANGIFLARVNSESLATLARDTVGLQAVFSPSNGLHADTASNAVRITPRGTAPLSLGWHLAAMLALLFCGVAIYAVERVDFRHMFRRQKAINRQAEASDVFIRPVPRSGSRDTTRIAGVVCDGHSGKALVGARITLSGANGSFDMRAERGGTFAVADLQEGTWLLRIVHPHHTARESQIEIPHDGRYDGAKFQLIHHRWHLRDELLAAFAAVSVPWRWGYQTPREALAKVDEPEAPLKRMTQDLEHAFYRDRQEDPAALNGSSDEGGLA